MALSKVNFNSMNVTPSASKAIKFNSSNNGLETGDLGGQLQLLSTQTASDSATIDFTSDIDSTYKEYQFRFTDIHPQTDGQNFQFQADTGTNTSYNQTMTTTFFRAYHYEDDSTTGLAYHIPSDLAQSTSFQRLAQSGNGNDECVSGSLHLFNPSSTTFVKHFIARVGGFHEADYAFDFYTAGYGNTTSAINAVQFKYDSGNIDSGVIKLYGIS